ncbi:MAG: hydrogenase subunit MbhD domain-containing protein [Chloroflexota bacterium]
MDSFFYGFLGLCVLVCSYRAMVSQRLLSSILYLACVSAAVSVLLYLMGAQQVAVIELSVGAGLVTVLLVYALSVVGEDAADLLSVIPKPLAFILVGLSAGLLLLMIFPLGEPTVEVASFSLTVVLWQQRVLDVWIQIVLIFSGVLGVLGLLSERIVPVGKKDEVHS